MTEMMSNNNFLQELLIEVQALKAFMSKKLDSVFPPTIEGPPSSSSLLTRSHNTYSRTTHDTIAILIERQKSQSTRSSNGGATTDGGDDEANANAEEDEDDDAKTTALHLEFYITSLEKLIYNMKRLITSIRLLEKGRHSSNDSNW